jgi:hypothetical protein
MGPPDPQESLAAVHARDGAGPAPGGVLSLRRSLDKFDRHARTASAPRLADKRGCNNELEADVAGTSVRSP